MNNYESTKIEDFGFFKLIEIACIHSDIYTVGALIDAANDIRHAPLYSLRYQSIRDMVEKIEESGIRELQVYPIHLAWRYSKDPVKPFDISMLPQNTEIDELSILPRLKNTLKLAGIYTIKELEKRYNNSDAPGIDYLLYKDINDIEEILDNHGFKTDITYPEHLDWMDPEEDMLRYKIAPFAPPRDMKIEILRVSSKYLNTLHYENIHTIGDLLDRYDKDKLYEVSGLGQQGREAIYRRMHGIGFYVSG